MRFPALRRRQVPRVMLVSKDGCPLCREAEAAVRRVFGASAVDVVDVHSSRQLEDLWVFRVPVLLVGERVLAEGHIDVASARVARRNAERLKERLS